MSPAGRFQTRYSCRIGAEIAISPLHGGMDGLSTESVAGWLEVPSLLTSIVVEDAGHNVHFSPST